MIENKDYYTTIFKTSTGGESGKTHIDSDKVCFNMEGYTKKHSHINNPTKSIDCIYIENIANKDTAELKESIKYFIEFKLGKQKNVDPEDIDGKIESTFNLYANEEKEDIKVFKEKYYILLVMASYDRHKDFLHHRSIANGKDANLSSVITKWKKSHFKDGNILNYKRFQENILKEKAKDLINE